jgi:hypothetical protein
MGFRQLRYVCAIADTGKFSRAAERCQIAQPSPSQQVLKLEEHLGEAAGRGTMGWRFAGFKVAFSPNRLAFGFFFPRSTFVNDCADGYQIRARHLYLPHACNAVPRRPSRNISDAAIPF